MNNVIVCFVTWQISRKTQVQLMIQILINYIMKKFWIGAVNILFYWMEIQFKMQCLKAILFWDYFWKALLRMRFLSIWRRTKIQGICFSSFLKQCSKMKISWLMRIWYLICMILWNRLIVLSSVLRLIYMWQIIVIITMLQMQYSQ